MAKTVEELNARKEEIGKRRDAIIAERVEATLSGKAFGANAELAKLNDELTTLDEAISVAGKREAAEDARYWEERRVKAIQDRRDIVTSNRDLMIDEVEKAERLTRELVESLSEIFKCSDKIVEQFNALEYPGLNTLNVETRMANRVLRLFSKIYSQYAPRRHHFGPLQWMPEHDRVENWAEEEADEMRRNVETLFKILDRKKS